MRYGIINKNNRNPKKHYGLIELNKNGSYGNIYLNIMNKSNSNQIGVRNKELFFELLKTINKFYPLEDLNKKNKSGLTQKQYKKIEIGEFKNIVLKDESETK